MQEDKNQEENGNEEKEEKEENRMDIEKYRNGNE